MRKPAAWVLTLLMALLGAGKLSALELYWWPVIDSNANDIRNWSTGSTGYALPGAANITGANLHFFGSGADLNDCTFTADASVAGIDGTIFFQNRTLSDGGNTLTLSGGFYLTHGTLNLTGVLSLMVSGASTISLGTPPGENLHTVQASISSTGTVQMLTDINVAGLTVTGTGSWDWQNQRTLTLRSSGTASFAKTISFINVRAAPLFSTITCSNSGSTLILNPTTPQPNLQIMGSTSLASIDSTEIIFNDANLALGTGAALALANDLAFTGASTITQGSSSLITSNGGSLIWREVNNFPASSGLTIDAPVVISQPVTGSNVNLTLPGGWSFGNSLTFLANEVVTGPGLTVNLDGTISATDISFANTVANTGIAISFDAAGASLTASGTVGINSSYLQVDWTANSAPILVTADSFDASDPFSALTLNWSTEGATLSADTSVGLMSMSASNAYTLLLPGAGDGSEDVFIDVPTSPTVDLYKTGTAQTLTLNNNIYLSELRVLGNTSTRITGSSVYFGNSDDIVLEDSGGINGDLVIDSEIDVDLFSTLVIDNQTSNARIIVNGDIYGFDGEVYGAADIDVIDGAFWVNGDDARSDGSGSTPSITYLSGASASARYNGNGVDIDVIATGDSTIFEGTGLVQSYASNAPYDAWVEPGGNANFGVLTIGDANFTGGSAGVFTRVTLEASGNSSPGSDYDQIITTNLTIDSGSTLFEVDLNGWSGAGRVDGILTYSTLTGDPSTATINLSNASGLDAVLVNDPSNQQIDLVVSLTGASPVSGVLVTPKIPISSSRSTIWVALSPGTPEGLTSLRNAIASKSSEQVRAYIWDPTTQAYVAYPSEPVGGLQPWHGWFVATRTPLSFSFDGTFNGAPHQTPLSPGWNFVGVGPVSDSSVDITQFPWDGLELWDSGDATVTDPTRTTVIGSSASWWNVNRYINTTIMTSGRAYWVFNSDVADYTLTYAAGSYSLPEFVDIIASSVGAAAAADRKSPPPPPGFSDEANDAKGGGCGGGSGLGIIFAFIALIGLRRQRIFPA